MARKQKTKSGQTNNVPAQKQFTDREEPQKSFLKALANVNNRNYTILTYYGVGGIGKSSLQEHLKIEHLDKSNDNVYSWIDFKQESNRVAHKAFRVLAKNFKSKFKISFTVFDIAYVIYWSKAFPDQEIKKSGFPFLEEGSMLSDSIDALADAGGILNVAFSLVNYTAKKLKEVSFDINIQQSLKELDGLEADEIEEKLAYFFAYDIDLYKKKNANKKIVIFLDTYEALWEINRSDANRYSQDKWIRDGLVTELHNVLFVICGREKIIWSECESEWKDDLDQHILGNLSIEDAKRFLISCNINDTLIQNEIISNSEGVPYYLDLSVDIFDQIKNNGNVPSKKDFSDIGQEEVFERFMRYLSTVEQETLKVLANSRFYTKGLFSLLIENFKTGYPSTAIYQLNSFSFISEEEGKFLMHDLMRKSLMSYQDNELNNEVNSFLFEYYNKSLQDLEIKSITQENIDTFSEAFYHKEKIGDIHALYEWFDKMFKIFRNSGKYKMLLELTVKIKDIYEKKFGTENLYTASAYYNLALLYDDIGNYQESLSFGLEAVKIREDLLGEEHLITANSYNHVAITYDCMGKYKDSLLFHLKALKIRKKLLGEYHSATANSYHNLSLLYYSQGKYKDALPLTIKVVGIQENVLGEDHQDMATHYEALAGIYDTLGKYEEALPLYTKTLEIRKKLLGEEHLDTARSYNNLGTFHSSLGQNEKALPFLSKSLKIRETLVGEEHQSTAESYNNLAILYEAIGKFEESLSLYQKALLIHENTLGEEHPTTASSYAILASYYDHRGHYKQALPLHIKALNIKEKVLGEEHSDTADSYINLASCYFNQGNKVEIFTLSEKALKIKKQVLGDEHKDTATCYNNLAFFYNDIGKYEQALPLYIKALELRKKVLGEEHHDTISSYIELANLYKTMGANSEALPLYVKAMEIRHKVLGEDHPSTADSYMLLAISLFEEGHKDEASVLYHKASTIKKY